MQTLIMLNVLGNIASDNANYKDAITYYKEALNKAKTVSEKKQVVLGISENYINLDELPRGKKICPNGYESRSKMGTAILENG